ncbi:hypothetical protein [Methylobacterium thuringiense]|uniref:Transmembrane protein n=1 Tax=Methylobacterium thuringiense TaxID=1003091 RepID=A0ABQ4TRR5_9HYPH|nr:hypothetical protein [Methylobacterium thuringiense]GJE57392.1 hypothetical protein EKPJFOCH_3906 [Methylobacterium thuringiense]
MRKLAITLTAALSLGALAAVPADARPGYRGGHGGYYGGHRGYHGGYVGRRGRGIGTGAAVGLGIAGLAAGAVAAGAYGNRGYDDGYGYRRRGYGY